MAVLRVVRHCSVAAVACLAASGLGCRPEPAGTATATVTSKSGANLPPLDNQIREIVQQQLADRRLEAQRHAAWQVLHGVLAYDYRLPLVVAGEDRPALEYLLDGGALDGWQFVPGDPRDDVPGRRGLRSVVEAGSKKGQGHRDQWLAIMAQCNVPRDAIIRVDGVEYTIDDLVWQAQRDVPRNFEREYSWTLIALSHYLPIDTTWQTSDGTQWSIERLLDIEIQQDVVSSACGGTHRLSAIAMAAQRYQRQRGALQGTWLRAQQHVQNFADLARQMQNPDGTFSVHFFQRPGSSPEISGNLAATGHVLEFLAISLPDEQLAQPWIEAAARKLSSMLHVTRHLDIECGALYHALNGLSIYHDRRFGSKSTGS